MISGGGRQLAGWSNSCDAPQDKPLGKLQTVAQQADNSITGPQSHNHPCRLCPVRGPWNRVPSTQYPGLSLSLARGELALAGVGVLLAVVGRHIGVHIS